MCGTETDAQDTQDMHLLNHRLATLTDLPQIIAIYNDTVASRMVTADTEPVSVASREPWFHQHHPGHRPLWVCETDGRITAWLSFSSFYGRPAYDKTVELSVYVHAEHRRRGLAKYLLAQALQHAPELCVDTLLGFIFAHNQPSLLLFEQFGFTQWAHLPGVALLDDVERDLIIVGRKV
jgi:L-amino acid N-acyltransferase YncA